MANRVGVFDSGVGGLSVWREIVRRLPDVERVYVADQAHLPYGPRAAPQILEFARGVTHFLVERRCVAVVVACNSASAAALQALRREFPAIPELITVAPSGIIAAAWRALTNFSATTSPGR